MAAVSTHKYDLVRGDWENKQEPCVSKARKKRNMELGRFVNTVRILHMCVYHIQYVKIEEPRGTLFKKLFLQSE